MILELVKTTPGIWNSLRKTVHKNDLVDLKQQIISQEHDRAAEEIEKTESKSSNHTHFPFLVSNP